MVRLAVVFSEILFCEEECDNAVTDRRMTRISPSGYRHVERTSSECVGRYICYV